MIDLHTHSVYSMDSNTPLDSLALQARKEGLEVLAVTDHWDYRATLGEESFLFDPESRDREFHLFQERHRSHLEILRGIEVGIQPGLGSYYGDLLAKGQYDFVIGSIHSIDHMEIFLDRPMDTMDAKELYARYFQNTIDALKETEGIHTLGHIDYLDRYMPIAYWKEFYPLLEEIMDLLIEREIALELNTAGWRKGLSHPHPKSDIMELYRKKKGKLITLGSDAHRGDEVGRDIQKGLRYLRERGFHKVYSRKNGTWKEWDIQ